MNMLEKFIKNPKKIVTQPLREVYRHDRRHDINADSAPLYMFVPFESMTKKDLGDWDKSVLKEKNIVCPADLRKTIVPNWYNRVFPDFQFYRNDKKSFYPGKGTLEIKSRGLDAKAKEEAQVCKDKYLAEERARKKFEDERFSQSENHGTMLELVKKQGNDHLRCITLDDLKARAGLHGTMLTSLRYADFYNLWELCQVEQAEHLSQLDGLSENAAKAIKQAVYDMGGFFQGDQDVDEQQKKDLLDKSRKWVKTEKLGFGDVEKKVDAFLGHALQDTGMEPQMFDHMHAMPLGQLGFAKSDVNALASRGIFSARDLCGYSSGSAEFIPSVEAPHNLLTMPGLKKTALPRIRAAAKAAGIPSVEDFANPELVRQCLVQSEQIAAEKGLSVPKTRNVMDGFLANVKSVTDNEGEEDQVFALPAVAHDQIPMLLRLLQENGFGAELKIHVQKRHIPAS